MSSNTIYKRVCAWCRTHFKAQKVTTKYCSHKCSSHAYKQKKREERLTTAKNEVLLPILQQQNTDQYKPSANNLSILKEKEYLSVAETAQLIGVGYTTTYNYCTSGKLKCIKMNRKIFIRRSDIDELFNSAPKYEVASRIIKPKIQTQTTSEVVVPTTDLITAAEASVLYGVSKDAIHRRANSHKIPWVLYEGKRHYSRKHFSEHYKIADSDFDITQWYYVEEIMEKYSTTKSSVYSLVSDNDVSRKNVKGKSIYLKKEIDALLKSRLGDLKIKTWYTVEDIYRIYGLKPHYIANFVFVNKIPKRRVNNHGEYSKSHFDNAIKSRNPSTVYLSIEDAAKQFKMTPEKIHTLITKHNIPKVKDGKLIRVQKTALDKIINPPKLYI